MKLIREVVEQVEYLTEEKDGKKNLYIVGPFLVSEKQNKNGRLYKEETMAREVDRYKSEYISKNRAFGELGHPDTPAITLERVSHRIVDLNPHTGNNHGNECQENDRRWMPTWSILTWYGLSQEYKRCQCCTG